MVKVLHSLLVCLSIVTNRPLALGDGTANSPTNLQISKFNEAQEEGVGLHEGQDKGN